MVLGHQVNLINKKISWLYIDKRAVCSCGTINFIIKLDENGITKYL